MNLKNLFSFSGILFLLGCIALFSKTIATQRFNRIVVIPDIHGDMDALKTILVRERIVDPDENIVMGDDVAVVSTGDLVDRGIDDLQILDFVMKLKRTKPDNIFLSLGNHEMMILQGDHHDSVVLNTAVGYCEKNPNACRNFPKEIRETTTAQARKDFLSCNGKYFQFILNNMKPINKVGDYLFMHGGISPYWASAAVEGMKKHNQEALEKAQRKKGSETSRGLSPADLELKIKREADKHTLATPLDWINKQVKDYMISLCQGFQCKGDINLCLDPLNRVNKSVWNLTPDTVDWTFVKTGIDPRTRRRRTVDYFVNFAINAGKYAAKKNPIGSMLVTPEQFDDLLDTHPFTIHKNSVNGPLWWRGLSDSINEADDDSNSDLDDPSVCRRYHPCLSEAFENNQELCTSAVNMTEDGTTTPMCQWIPGKYRSYRHGNSDDTECTSLIGRQCVPADISNHQPKTRCDLVKDAAKILGAKHMVVAHTVQGGTVIKSDGTVDETNASLYTIQSKKCDCDLFLVDVALSANMRPRGATDEFIDTLLDGGDITQEKFSRELENFKTFEYLVLENGKVPAPHRFKVTGNPSINPDTNLIQYDHNQKRVMAFDDLDPDYERFKSCPATTSVDLNGPEPEPEVVEEPIPTPEPEKPKPRRPAPRRPNTLPHTSKLGRTDSNSSTVSESPDPLSTSSASALDFSGFNGKTRNNLEKLAWMASLPTSGYPGSITGTGSSNTETKSASNKVPPVPKTTTTKEHRRPESIRPVTDLSSISYYKAPGQEKTTQSPPPYTYPTQIEPKKGRRAEKRTLTDLTKLPGSNPFGGTQGTTKTNPIYNPDDLPKHPAETTEVHRTNPLFVDDEEGEDLLQRQREIEQKVAKKRKIIRGRTIRESGQRGRTPRREVEKSPISYI